MILHTCGKIGNLLKSGTAQLRRKIQFFFFKSFQKLLDLASSFPGCKAKSAMYKDQIITAVAESYLNSLDGRVSQDDDVEIIDITEEAMNDNNNVDVTNVACDASCNKKYLHYGNKVVLFRSAFLLQKVFFSAFFPNKQPLFSGKRRTFSSCYYYASSSNRYDSGNRRWNCCYCFKRKPGCYFY